MAISTDPINSYQSQLNAISNPQEKFNLFDEITSKELSSVGFQVLTEVARDPNFYESCTSLQFTLGFLGPYLIQNILSATERCKKLSDEMMRSLSTSDRNHLWSSCSQIETYIDSKIFQTLSRIVLSKNFSNSSNPSHPLYPISQEMWKFQSNNHGLHCGCHTHIQTHLHFGAKSSTKVTQITVKCNASSESKLFIRGVGPGMSWDRGIELKNKGDGIWVFETLDTFSKLEYKVLLNDSQWETGENHKLEHGKKEEIRPNF